MKSCVSHLVHGSEVEPEVREERQGELEAGIEEEVKEVSPADCTQSSHVGVIHILQWRKLNKKYSLGNRNI